MVQPATATVIGPNQTVASTDPSLVGQNIDFRGQVMPVSGTDPSYDSGAALLSVDPALNQYAPVTYALGTGPNQIQCTGSGGFLTTSTTGNVVLVNLGGQTPPAVLTWRQGGFAPARGVLVLGGAELQNGIDLGKDTSATLQIDVMDLDSHLPGLLENGIQGSGNLVVRAYGPPSTTVAPGPSRQLFAGLINLTGTVTVDNVALWAEISASNVELTDQARLIGITSSAVNMTLAGNSVFAVQSDGLSVARESLGLLNCSDPASTIILGVEVYGIVTELLPGVLIVQGGYFAGKILDGVSPDQSAQYPTGGGSLIKTGPGFFTLASDNSVPQATVYGTFRGYSVGTTVEQGTLLVTNSTGSATGTGPVTVLSGGSLGGYGQIATAAHSRLIVYPGGMMDLRANDPAHPMSDLTHTFRIQLQPSTRAIFEGGFGFNLNGNGHSNCLAFSGLTANQTQVFLNNNAVTFTKLPAAQPGVYTIMTFDQSGAYSGTLAPQSGCKFIYAPKAVQVQIF